MEGLREEKNERIERRKNVKRGNGMIERRKE
jgi:hypothetical protein